MGGGATCVAPVVGLKRSVVDGTGPAARPSVVASKPGINCSENPAIKHQTINSASSAVGKKSSSALDVDWVVTNEPLLSVVAAGGVLAVSALAGLPGVEVPSWGFAPGAD